MGPMHRRCGSCTIFLMTTEKQRVIKLIDRMPDSVSTETIISELHFRLTILRRGEESERGENIVTHDEAKRRLGKWLNSSGT